MESCDRAISVKDGVECMSDKVEKRTSPAFGTKTPMERDIEKTITDLIVGKETGEPVKIGKKIIRTADSETTITYELVVNPRTGQQEVIENIVSNKRQCSTCGAYVSTLYTCSLCGKAVCGQHYGSIETVDGFKNVVYDDWNDKDWLGGPKAHSRQDPVYRHLNVCSNCYFVRTGKRWE